MKKPAAWRACCLAAAALCCWAWATPAAADTVTPRIKVSTGYDDNIRLLGESKKDGFFTITPGLSVETGRASNRLVLDGSVQYSYYLEQDEFTGFDGGTLNAGWTYQPSPTTTFEVQNRFSSSYDPVLGDDTGAAAQSRIVRGRHDRNVASVRLSHQFGPRSSVYAGYSYTYNYYEDDDAEGGNQHSVNTGVSYKMGNSLVGEVSATATRDSYDRSDTVDRVSGQVKATYLVDQTQEAFAAFSYTTAMSQAEDPVLRDAREYQVYGISFGYMQRVTPTFDWQASVGYSRVEGDPTYNEMAGSGYPTLNVRTSYKGERFTLTGRAEVYLGEYGYLGENSGLTVTQRFGATGMFELSRYWTFTLSGDFIRDRAQQKAEAAGLDSIGDVDTILITSILSYQVTENSNVGLEYRYLRRDAELDSNDERQNRVLLFYSSRWPNKW